MGGNELALEMGGKLGDGKFVAGGDGLEIVAIGFAFSSALEVEEAGVPRGDLHRDVSEIGGPGADRIEGVERRSIGSELGEEDAGALNRFHECAPSTALSSKTAIHFGQRVVLSFAEEFNRGSELREDRSEEHTSELQSPV